jgi:hypothetical protein
MSSGWEKSDFPNLSDLRPAHLLSLITANYFDLARPLRVHRVHQPPPQSALAASPFPPSKPRMDLDMGCLAP